MTQLLTVVEAAALLGKSPRQVRRLVLEGEIPAHKLGAATRAYVLERGVVEAFRRGTRWNPEAVKALHEKDHAWPAQR